MVSRSCSRSGCLIPTDPSEPKETHDLPHEDDNALIGVPSLKTHQANGDPIGSPTTSPKTHQANKIVAQGVSSFHLGKTASPVNVTSGINGGSEVMQEDSGRERLKRQRIDVAGQVWIPDIWGQEELLKDWLDCSSFDASLVPSGIISARAALVNEGRRANSGRLKIENRC